MPESLAYVSSGQQLVNCLIKGLGTRECNSACDKMGMRDIYHPSWGEVLSHRLTSVYLYLAHTEA
jgi:hypothetical protein